MKFIQVLAVVVGILFIGALDYEEEQTQHAFYCEMVSIWKADAARGVPEEMRRGWPPFNGDC